MSNTNPSKKKSRPEFMKSSWGERHTVIAISFLMTALNYSMRFNLSIGIVAMVSDERTTTILPTSSSDSSSSQAPQQHPEIMCPALGTGLDGETTPATTTPATFNSSTLAVIRKSQVNKTIPLSIPEETTNNPTFNWDEKDQGLVLGSFFWGYVISQIPGGLIAQKYGAKWVIGLSMLSTGILSIGLPYAAILGGRDYVIGVRILQGFSEGFIVPALVNLMAKWAPSEELARLSGMVYAGFPFGTSMTMLVSGYLIPEYGWPAVFYFPGILTLILFAVWMMKVYSSPEDHPNISAEELMHIRSSIDSKSNSDLHPNNNTDSEQGKDVTEGGDLKLKKVPWMEILCSAPVWAVCISQFCSAWGHNMLKAEGPKYLHSALHFDIHENSYVAASPYLAQVFFTMFIGRLSDFLMERKVISMLTARKLCNSIGQWGIALAFLGIIASGCNRLPAVICYILSGMVNGAMNCGTYINIMDISPNYAGAIEGVINSAANVAGCGAPYLAGIILYYEPSILGWCYVFGVPVAINVIGNLVFLVWAEVKVQSWDEQQTRTDPPTEMEVIQ